jgi:hypothetical protein
VGLILADLSHAKLTNTLSYLAYNNHLIQFSNCWDDMKSSLDDPEIIRYITTVKPGGKKGRKMITHTKSAICEKLAQTSDTCDLYYTCSKIPVTVVSVFGPAAILFCPNEFGSYRGRFPVSSAALEILKEIAKADQLGVLKAISAKLKPPYRETVHNWSALGFQ